MMGRQIATERSRFGKLRNGSGHGCRSKNFVFARPNRAPFLNLEFAQLLCSDVVQWASSRKLFEQRLRFLQIERVDSLSEPAVDLSFASLIPPGESRAKVDPDLMGGEVICEAKASAPVCGRSNGQSDWRATPAALRRSRRCARTSSRGAAWPPPRRAGHCSK
jgi:hypothetical protein